MKIQSLHLENYRCFQKLDIAFDKQLTVIVGVNGSGKTAILDAVAVFLKGLTYSLPLTNGAYRNPAMFLKDIAINNISQGVDYEIVIAMSNSFSEDEKAESIDLKFKFQKDSMNSESLKLIENNLEFRNFFLKVQGDNFKVNRLGMPVAAYYRSRQIGTVKGVPNANVNAYTDAFEPQIDFSATVRWFIEKDAEEARKQRKNRQYQDPELKAIRTAVSLALGRYGEPFVDGTPPILYISPKDSDDAYTVEQLSDGYRAMLAMIMDLARRMAMANGRLEYYSNKSVLESPAIVLIDEIELHLHPSWQQTVLPTLMHIFPNTQFIVTTHSDQVLTSIPAKYILILKDGRTAAAPEESEGADSGRILKRIFAVDPRPNNNEFVKKLDEYADLVYAEQWDTAKAVSLKDDLEQHFGKDNEPRLKELELHIDNAKWEKSL